MIGDPTVPLCASESIRGLQEEGLEDEGAWEYMVNAALALLCVSVAALAAGLTLGPLGLDPLLLLIKERAADDPAERLQASRLLPVVQKHHLLLVTLLLMNACANEALPLFLEKLVPPAFAVLVSQSLDRLARSHSSLAFLFNGGLQKKVSVTRALFFGEIIPSAIQTPEVGCRKHILNGSSGLFDCTNCQSRRHP